MSESANPSAGEQAKSPQERVTESMRSTVNLIRENLVTDAHKVAFMTRIELHLNQRGQLLITPANEDYDSSHIVEFMQLNGEPPETDLKIHMPKNMVGHQYEYTYMSSQDDATVQRAEAPTPMPPQRAGDAEYVEWVGTSIANAFEDMRKIAGGHVEHDPEHPQITYAPNQSSYGN